MKAATIYERSGKIFVHSSSQTTAGVWILTSPVFLIEKDDVHELGGAIQKCLASSDRGVSHPKTFASLFDPVLALAGVKSFSAFVKLAKCVEVEMENDVVSLIPTRNGGMEEGFVPLPNHNQVTFESDEKLGLAAISVLSKAI